MAIKIGQHETIDRPPAAVPSLGSIHTPALWCPDASDK